jgi:predicted RNase H-like HicB family nuclease
MGGSYRSIGSIMAVAPMTFKINLEWDAEEQVWVSSVPDLGDISTYGETLEEVIAQTREAVLGYLEIATEKRLPLPDNASLLRSALERRPTPV